MSDTGFDEEGRENKASARDVLRFSLYYWKPNKRLGLTSAVLMMSSVIMDAVLPIYHGRLVDAFVSTTDKDAGAALAWEAFWVIALIAVSFHVFRINSMYCWNKFAVRNLYNIVTDGMQKVQRFSADWHANSFAGGTVRKVTRGMWSFDQFEDTLLMGILPAVTMMVAITIVLCLKLPLVGLVTTTLVVIYCAFSIWMSIRVLAPRFRASADMDTKIGATLADIITGNPTVKSFGAEKREDSHFINVATTWRKKAYHAWQWGITADAIRSAFRVIMTTAMISTTIWLWHQGRATPGDIVLVITAYGMIGGYLRDIGMHITHLQRAVSEMDDIVTFWMREDDVVDAAAAVPLKVARGKIVFDRVCFRYGNTDRDVYTDLSVEIRPGEKLALVGPSGSGKSTFVKLLQRLYNVTGGRILVDGQDISRVTLESLRQNIALVPQDPTLFHRSLSDNIAYGRPGASAGAIEEAAKKSYAHDFIMSLPKGYGTLVGERGVKLSGGERQRVAIARAILADAPILILDEATSSLDSISEHYIQKALAALMAGRTTITIAHRLSTIQQADRILVFDDGRIVEEGTHKALMANPASHYKKLYDMQVLGLVEDGRSEAA